MPDNTQNQPLFGQPAVSPKSLEYRRLLAAQLMKEGMESTPIRSPWQGVGRIVQSAVGGWEAGQLDKSEQAARQQLIQDAINARQGGDPAKLLGLGLNPWVPDRVAGDIVGKSFPANIDTGGYVIPQSQITGQQAAPAIERQQPGTMATPAGSMPTFTTPSQSGIAPPGAVQPVRSAPLPPAGPAPGSPQSRINADFRQGGFDAAATPNTPENSVIGDRFRRFATEANALEANRISATGQATSNATLLAEHRKEGLRARETVADLETLRDLGRRAGYGLSAEVKKFVGDKTGIPTEGLSENQAYTSFINRFAPTLRPEGSGGLRAAELTGFTNSLGGLMTTKEGRELGISTMAKIANYKVRLGEIAGGPGTDQEKIAAMNNVRPPEIDFGEIKRLTAERQKSGGFDVSHGGREYFKDPATGKWFLR